MIQALMLSLTEWLTNCLSNSTEYILYCTATCCSAVREFVCIYVTLATRACNVSLSWASCIHSTASHPISGHRHHHHHHRNISSTVITQFMHPTATNSAHNCNAHFLQLRMMLEWINKIWIFNSMSSCCCTKKH